MGNEITCCQAHTHTHTKSDQNFSQHSFYPLTVKRN